MGGAGAVGRVLAKPTAGELARYAVPVVLVHNSGVEVAASRGGLLIGLGRRR